MLLSALFCFTQVLLSCLGEPSQVTRYLIVVNLRTPHPTLSCCDEDGNPFADISYTQAFYEVSLPHLYGLPERCLDMEGPELPDLAPGEWLSFSAEPGSVVAVSEQGIGSDQACP